MATKLQKVIKAFRIIGRIFNALARIFTGKKKKEYEDTTNSETTY